MGGLNPDPCKAKYLEKSGITTKKPRAQSAPLGGRKKVEESEHFSDGTPTRKRPTSVPPGGRRREKQERDLQSVTSVQCFLEQQMKVPGRLPEETFTQVGAWPIGSGGKKPDNIEELLYHGVSQNREGRLAYLKARSFMAPQKKYNTQ